MLEKKVHCLLKLLYILDDLQLLRILIGRLG